VIEIRRYDPNQDTGVLEFLPGKTIVHIGRVAMVPLFSRERFLAKFVPDGFWLAVDGREVRGAVLVGVIDGADPPLVATYGIKVDISYRRQGIGYQLVQKVDRLAEMTGIDRLVVETRSDNIAALAFFKRCGYTAIETTPENTKMEKRRSDIRAEVVEYNPAGESQVAM
jgi:ribosomal protein S18 acetylase RimI-like enzyme